VLLKTLAINELYNTHVLDNDVETLARYIVTLDIDPLIHNGEGAVVDRVATCPGVRHYFSFASKFCSWHNPVAYPIYDSHAERCLWYYKGKDSFTDYSRDHYGYPEFVRIVTAFREHYGLTQFTFKELDKFLYSRGRQLLDASDELRHAPDEQSNARAQAL
jgi:hypothetical protein